MKYIIFMVTLLVSSCGIKEKLVNWNNSDALGVPKQNTSLDKSDFTSVDGTHTSHSQKIIETTYTEQSNDVDDETNYYFYLIPFVILGILAFLVFRLKKQNMNSL